MMATSSAMQRYSRRQTRSAASAANRLLRRQSGARGVLLRTCLKKTASTEGQHSAPRVYKNDYVPEEGLTAAGRALVLVEHP